MTEKPLTRIGTVELISFPDESVSDVPAKIDTGADSSAIWASSIFEQNNQLSFILFDKLSPFYTGKVHTTSNYELISIKNSFGQSEFRYRVKLRIKLGGKVIRVNCTLANRRTNRYPILIGRKTLHGKFLVDVTKKSGKNELRILMLSTKRTEVTQTFAKNVQKSGQKLRVTYAAYEDLYFKIGSPKDQIILQNTGRDIASFDLVHFKTTARLMDVAAATARYLEQRNVQFIDEAIKHFPATSKLYQYVILNANGVTVPKSIFLLPDALAKSFNLIKSELGLPFVIKDIHGNKGEYNYYIKNEAGFNKAIKQMSEAGVKCIAQAFIPNDCDYRVLVFGNRISLVIKRTRLSNKTHLNNTSQGAHSIIVPATELPPSIQTMCAKGAKLLERQVAGVDIVKDKDTGLWYCLEVNDGPQLASGSFTAEKHAAFASYLERKLA